MFRFEDLEIWKLAIEYGNELYDVAAKFPPVEIYALSSQLRRAAVSISNNIAEGSGGVSTKDFCLFLDIGVKSALETVNILCFAEMRGYITKERKMELYEKAEKIIRKTRSFKRTL